MLWLVGLTHDGIEILLIAFWTFCANLLLPCVSSLTNHSSYISYHSTMSLDNYAISSGWPRKNWMMSSRKCNPRKSLSRWCCSLRPVNLDPCFWTYLPLIVVRVIVGGVEAWKWSQVTAMCFWFCSVCSNCSQSSWVFLCLLLWFKTWNFSRRQIQCKLDGECGLSKK